jgi:hypothetical protein
MQVGGYIASGYWLQRDQRNDAQRIRDVRLRRGPVLFTWSIYCRGKVLEKWLGGWNLFGETEREDWGHRWRRGWKRWNMLRRTSTVLYLK